MAAEQDKSSMRRFYEEVFNKGNIAVIDELSSPNFVDHDPMNANHDLEGVRQFTALAHAAFPDVHFAIEDLIAADDKVVARFRMTGTHRGDFMGIAPTGKQVNVTGIDIIRFENGKAVEHWGEFDAMGMMQQLGVVEPLGQG